MDALVGLAGSGRGKHRTGCQVSGYVSKQVVATFFATVAQSQGFRLSILCPRLRKSGPSDALDPVFMAYLRAPIRARAVIWTVRFYFNFGLILIVLAVLG